MKVKEIAIMIGSFALMAAFWSYMFGSQEFAVAMLILLAVHEAGHYFAALWLKMKVSMPIFTPIGALINIRERPANAIDEAFMAYAGPLLGSLAAMVCYLLGLSTENEVLIEAAEWGFFLNLFNLIPFSPMDGGRICMAINYRLTLVGFVVFLAVFYLYIPHSQLNIVLGVFLLWQGVRTIQDAFWLAKEEPKYFAVGLFTRVLVAASYLTLAGCLTYMLYGNQLPAVLKALNQIAW